MGVGAKGHLLFSLVSYLGFHAASHFSSSLPCLPFLSHLVGDTTRQVSSTSYTGSLSP